MRSITLLAATLTVGLTVSNFAAAAEEPASPHSFTGNVGLFSQYVFRGLAQTNEEVALQGGFDYSHSVGIYAGLWGSNISWLRDAGAYKAGGSAEIDLYAGYKGAAAGSCEAGVVRDGEGGPYVEVTLPDGRMRTIFFNKDGSFLSFSTAQADGTAAMKVGSSREGDTTIATLGTERYEIPDALIQGG